MSTSTEVRINVVDRINRYAIAINDRVSKEWIWDTVKRWSRAGELPEEIRKFTVASSYFYSGVICHYSHYRTYIVGIRESDGRLMISSPVEYINTGVGIALTSHMGDGSLYALGTTAIFCSRLSKRVLYLPDYDLGTTATLCSRLSETPKTYSKERMTEV